jgi:DNA-binding NarL/FixJ family response regulator
MAEGLIYLFLVDDHRMFREGLASLVALAADIQVVGQSAGGANCLGEILAAKPDVVVLDIAMPGFNGLDLCRLLRQQAPDMGVLFMTMLLDDDMVARALEYGASAYLTKDASPEQFIEGVRATARREVYLGPGISRAAIQRIGRRGDDPYERLSTRERQVFQLIAESKTNREIAEALGTALKTVVNHRVSLMRKLQIHDHASLVKYAIRKGVVRLD